MPNQLRNRLTGKHIAAVHNRMAAVVGAVALGLAAIAFARIGEMAQKLFLTLVTISPYAPFVITPAVFAAVVHVTRRSFPAARGSGIPQVMAATHNPERQATGDLLSLKTAWAKLIGTVAMLMAGGSVGREGPTVQISAALMVAVHRWLRVPVTAGVIIAGGAAGVAAAFNTPLAGVAFAIEELAAAFEQKVAVMVMAAVMISGLVSLGLAGDYVYFGAMDGALPLHVMFVAAPLAGVLGGILGGLFSRSLIAMTRPDAPWLMRLRSRPVVLAALCGLVVALTGWSMNGLSWGTGYETTKTLLEGHSASLIFGPAKFVATLATALSGAPGGIFAPSLSVGAGLGQLISTAFPNSPAGAIVLLGMVGYFTGVVRAPMTAVIIMMEMTADRTMVLPLFATALIADAVSAAICQPKLYHALSSQFYSKATQET
ncbi:chloride channel protein [Novosphingobium sp. KCTC 2891]|uniref:chloride channel protein n=1 Tax=Novosphingobium sp. KCTC 2891 TaxID=2989730 RepID=UPI002223E11A|nr:chloride channel protein [Novosphingobium sp. KCTC 2891]MCW1381978.1 chloride channel protein [Novosphingobium sp. KCTC 2891]